MRTRFVEFIAFIALASAPCRGQGIISTVAGDITGAACVTTSGIPATSACMDPSGLAMDKQAMCTSRTTRTS
jgi:hypothetical protein